MSTQAFTDSNYPYFEVTSDNTKIAAVPQQAAINLAAHAPASFWTEVDTDGNDIHLANSAGTTEYALRLVDWNKGSNTGWIVFDAQALSTSSDVTLRVYVANGAAARPASNEAYTNPEYVFLDTDLESDTAADESQHAMSVTESGTVTTASMLMGDGIDCDGDYLEYDYNETATDHGEPPGTAGTTIANTGLVYDSGLNSGAGGWYIGKFDDTAANGEIQEYNLDFSTEVSSHTLGFAPQDIAIDGDGIVWIADPANEKLWALDPSDSWSTTYEISMPAGYAVNGVAYRSTNDRIYVFETGNTTWRLYDPSDGSFDTTLTADTGGDGLTWWSDFDVFIMTLDPDILRLVDPTTGNLIGAEFVDGTIDHIEGCAIYDGRLYINDDAEYHAGDTDGNRVYSMPMSAVALIASGGRNFTYRAVITIDSVSGTDALIAHGNPVAGDGWGLYATSTTNLRPFIRDTSGNRVFADRTITAGQRVVHIVIDRTNDDMQVYVDGSKVSTDIDISSVTGRVQASDESIAFGDSPDGDVSRPADAKFDCGMVRLGAMTANEITTDYNSLGDNANFWTAGSWVTPSGIIPQVMHHRRLMSCS